jgi:hypothetical protein
MFWNAAMSQKSWAKDEIRERVLFQLLLAAIVQYQSFYALFYLILSLLIIFQWPVQ